MRFFRMTLSYDGTAYGGWQMQVNRHTIQAEVERALQIVTGQSGRLLLGRHDFSSFEAAGSKRANSVRTIFDLSVHRQAGEHLDRVVIEVEADGFLYNMVRNIVGTLVQVGRGKQPVSWVAEALQAKDRKAAGMTAPPEGLILMRVWCVGDLPEGL